MVSRISIESYFSRDTLNPLVDVRTPAEFAAGHIPGAVNIPLFTNEERAEVGTVYKRKSREEAIDLGYRFVNPKLDYFIDATREVAGTGKVTVYCWRGGMRSAAFAEHISDRGRMDAEVIEGGYKAFRNHVMQQFNVPCKLVVLGGLTGSGKTKILHRLRDMGEQVMDLEGLANHRGSAFGSIGMGKQPTTEHFANMLFMEWKTFDKNKRVWVEDESIHIGRVFLPENFFRRIRDGRIIFLKIPREPRARFLVGEYTGIDNEMLRLAVMRISKRLGGLRTREAVTCLEKGNFHSTALIALEYYDKYYMEGLERRDPEKVVIVNSDNVDIDLNSGLVLDASKGLFG